MKKACLFFLLLTFVVACCPRVHAEDMTLSTLRARHLEALGGATALMVPAKPQRMTGTEENGGLKGTILSVSNGLRQEWIRTTLGVYTEFTGDDGTQVWRRDSNGCVRLLAGEELKDHRTDQYVATYSYLFPDRLPGKVTLRPQTEGHTGCYILDVVPDGGMPAALFFDPKSFLIVKQERQNDGATSTITYSDFHALSGVNTATNTRIHGGEKKYDDVIKITEVQNNVDIPDTLFNEPPSTLNYMWTKPGMTRATLSFSDADGGISLYTALNGRPAFLELDSGASMLGISSIATDKLQIAHEGILAVGGYGGELDTFPIKVGALELPDAMVFGNMTGRSLRDFDADNIYYNAVPTVGIIGYDLLSRFVVKVDYVAGLLTLIEPDSFTPTPADGTSLPMEINYNLPTVQASFDGLPPARFLVDTGDTVAAVQLYAGFIAQNKLAVKYPKGLDIYGMGVGGINKTRRVRAQSLAIGNITVKNVPTDLSSEKVKNTDFTMAGALGSKLLSHFTVTFDYPHGRIFLAPNMDTGKSIDTRTFGVEVIVLHNSMDLKKPVFTVVYIDPKSPAAHSDLEVNDQILAVDDQPAAVLGLGGIRRLLSPDSGKDTRTLSVIGSHGGTGTVKLTLYNPLP